MVCNLMVMDIKNWLFIYQMKFLVQYLKIGSKPCAYSRNGDGKNWLWHNDYKIPNGVHVYGRRYDPFGPDNYPAELEKIRQMLTIRDKAIWLAAQKEKTNLQEADKNTRSLPEIKTNFNPEQNGSLKYLYGEDALAKLKVPEGYKIELFASEVEFRDLANPVQMSFDNKGRLWVATMPSYPHYKPGDSKPNDKLIILEDTNNDGRQTNKLCL